MTQLILTIKDPKEASLIKKLLAKFDSVTVHTRRIPKSTTEQIESDPELMASIKRGERDLAEGRVTPLTTDQIRQILGL